MYHFAVQFRITFTPVIVSKYVTEIAEKYITLQYNPNLPSSLHDLQPGVKA